MAVQLCARARRWEELRQIASEALAAQAARDVTLSVDFHDLLIRLARRAGDWRLALRSYHAMAVAGVAPTAATLSMLVAVLVAAGQGDEARRVVQQIRGAHALPVGQLNVQVRMDGERVIGVLKKRTPGTYRTSQQHCKLLSKPRRTPTRARRERSSEQPLWGGVEVERRLQHTRDPLVVSRVQSLPRWARMPSRRSRVSDTTRAGRAKASTPIHRVSNSCGGGGAAAPSGASVRAFHTHPLPDKPLPPFAFSSNCTSTQAGEEYEPCTLSRLASHLYTGNPAQTRIMRIC